MLFFVRGKGEGYPDVLCVQRVQGQSALASDASVGDSSPSPGDGRGELTLPIGWGKREGKKK